MLHQQSVQCLETARSLQGLTLRRNNSSDVDCSSRGWNSIGWTRSKTKSLQLLGMHALSGCDATSYLYSKGKTTALNTLLSGNFGWCRHVMGETHQLIWWTFYYALYNQVPGTSIECARFNFFTKSGFTSDIYSMVCMWDAPCDSCMAQYCISCLLSCIDI